MKEKESINLKTRRDIGEVGERRLGRGWWEVKKEGIMSV